MKSCRSLGARTDVDMPYVMMVSLWREACWNSRGGVTSPRFVVPRPARTVRPDDAAGHEFRFGRDTPTGPQLWSGEICWTILWNAPASRRHSRQPRPIPLPPEGQICAQYERPESCLRCAEQHSWHSQPDASRNDRCPFGNSCTRHYAAIIWSRPNSRSRLHCARGLMACE
jgi:hypothetical protein